jgi:predicted O-methyltransferase YrrM
MIGGTAAELAECVVQVCRDSALWERLSHAGQMLAAQRCSSALLTDRLRALVQSAPVAAPSRGADASSNGEPRLLCWPMDHYYSPVPDSRALAREPTQSRVWPAKQRTLAGIDWREDRQTELLQDALSRQNTLEFADEPTGDASEYHAGNGMFSRLDAWTLQSMLRHFRPRRMIEVGSGWSTLVTARVNREHFDRWLKFTCIEPHPPEMLSDGVDGVSRLIVSPVEHMPIELFLELGQNDVLFIDSSHTVKTGGDVVFLFEEVLPRLRPGVLVHVHDVFLPSDYPKEWVFSGRAWNEQYLVRAFLTFNSDYRILLSVAWMCQCRPDVLAAVLPDYPAKYRDGGGSLWIQRT